MQIDDLAQERVVYRDTVAGGRYWSMVIKRGFTLRLTDVEGGANVSMLLYNPANPLERYNMADTLKGQHTFKLTRGNMLYSDMGRVMLSIVADRRGWHDSVGGFSDGELVQAKYGRKTYQQARNDFYRSGRELFLIELGKWGLGKQDIVPNLNLFSRIATDDAGNMRFVPIEDGAGDYVDLRAEMDTLVVLNTAQHPLAPNPAYAPKPVELAIYRSDPVVPEDDYCCNFRPENARAYANTAIYNCQG